MTKCAYNWSRVLYVIALLACFTGLGFYIATAAGASNVFLNIGIWLILGAVVVAIIARALTGKKIVD
ncbi:MAG: hypothetical protein J1E99_05610 [Muribaculaceae bacterium]|nr:hypothetical protein [Muribaculaceae bacterium]